MLIKMRESRKGEDGTVLLKGSSYPVSDIFGAGLVAAGLADNVSNNASTVGTQQEVTWNPATGTLVRDGTIQLPIQVTDPSGRPVSRAGRPLKAPVYPDVEGALIYFPLMEGTGNKVYDIAGQLIGSVNGGSSGQRWGQAGPGISLNGTNNRIACTDGAQGGFTFSAKHICDLSTLLARDDQITVFGVVSHPATIPADSWMVSWGMNADALGKGGWAIGLKVNSGKLAFGLRPKGGNATVVTAMGVSGARGANSDNTRTVWAMEICASGVSGLLELRAYQLTIGTDGGNAQSNVGLDTPAMVPNGTGLPASDVTSPLMIGAWADTNTSSWTGYVGPNMALAAIGLKRGARDPGVGMRICRDLRANANFNNLNAIPESAK